MSKWFGGDALIDILRPLARDGFGVFHDVDMWQGRVQHLVVGMCGVYTIEARSWRGRVHLGSRGRLMHGRLRGESAKRSVLDAATLVRRRLAASGIDRSVTGMIALTSTSLPHGPIDLRNVVVVEADQIPAFLRRKQPKLKTVEVDMIRQIISVTARAS